jgi:hypothetical protein
MCALPWSLTMDFTIELLSASILSISLIWSAMFPRLIWCPISSLRCFFLSYTCLLLLGPLSTSCSKVKADSNSIVKFIVRDHGKAPCIILYTDDQLEDIKNVCCSGQSILGIDKTFNLCNMLLVNTFINQLLINVLPKMSSAQQVSRIWKGGGNSVK